MSDPEHPIDRLRTGIENSDDRKALLAFSDEMYLLKTPYSDYRHEKPLRHCTLIAEETNRLAAALTERAATEVIVRWINRTYDNEETNRDYRVALRVFGRRTSDENDDEPPDAIDWIPSGTSFHIGQQGYATRGTRSYAKGRSKAVIRFSLVIFLFWALVFIYYILKVTNII